MSPARETVSACLIVRDEEARLPATLASLAFCDEIVVVDSESTDRTVEIARAAGAVVVVNPWPGFAAQRNVALDHASSDWILEVDADERVTPELRDEILAFLTLPPPADVDLAVLPRRNRFLGRPLGPAAKYPEYRERLLRRGTQRHDETRLVHEGLQAVGRVWAFRGDLEHELAGTWREAVTDLWRYARLESGHVAPLDSPLAYAKAIVARPAAKAGYRLLLDGGWRDGLKGAAWIARDALADALTWGRRATGRVPAGARGDGHFGRLTRRTGPVRIAGIAYGVREATAAIDWLRAAHAAGADVALLTDAPGAGGSVATDPRPGPAPGAEWLHLAPLPRARPAWLMRRLDGVEQMRPVDQLMPFGPRARRHAGLVPAHLRGAVLPGDPATAAADAVAALTRETRG